MCKVILRIHRTAFPNPFDIWLIALALVAFATGFGMALVVITNRYL